MRRFLASVIIAVGLTAIPAGAQDSTTVAIGATVRVRLADEVEWQRGRFGGMFDDSLVLRSLRGGTSRRLSVAELGEVQLRRNDFAKRKAHAALGVLAGAAGGGIALYLSVRHCEAREHHSEGPPCAIGYAGLPLFAIVGAGVGGIVGAALPASRWEHVVLKAP